MNSAEVRGARLAWTQTGSGSPVVWAHGLSSSAYQQERAGQFDWRPVSAGHRLLRYDARGHGRSTGGTDPTEYTWPELGRDLNALLDVVAPGESVSAIGASMGAATILYAALQSPERFDRLVLATPPTFWESRVAQYPLRRESADLVERHGLRALQERAVDEPASPALAEADRFITPVTVSPERYPAVLRGSADSDLPAADVLATITCPTLILAWSGDEGHPLSSGHLLVDVLPDADYRVARTPEQLHTWPALVADFLAP